MSEYVLAIDCGTQSLRAVIISGSGEIAAIKKLAYEPYVSPNPGQAEQDPQVYLNTMVSACNYLKKNNNDLWRKIQGVGISSMRDSPVFVDKNNQPVRKAIIWLDERKTPPYYSAKGFFKLIVKMIGMEEALKITGMDGKTNWVRFNQPDIWNKTDKILMISGYLNTCLTGEFTDSVASQIGHLPFNFKKRRWSKPNEQNMQIFPIEEDKLPDIVEPGGELGRVTKKADELTGIPAGLPVIACGSDKGCETLGMGVLDPTKACLSFGSAATVQTTCKKYYEPLRFLPSYPAAIPGFFNPEIQIYRGYWMITWFKNEFGYEEKIKAEEAGVIPEHLLNDLLKEVPAGSMGLMVQPHWKPLLKEPNQKGAIIGFGDAHKRAHVYRAVIEGLAYALKDGLHKIEKRGGVKTDTLGASGGASQSDEICQIAADVFNKPLYRGQTHESTALGAAIITAVGTGIHPDIKTAVKEMVKKERFFKPDPNNVHLYHDLYKHVYSKMSKELHHLNKKIRRIVNYPEIV